MGGLSELSVPRLSFFNPLFGINVSFLGCILCMVVRAESESYSPQMWES